MEIDKPQLAVYAAAAIAIALIGARYLRDSRPAADAGGAAKAVPVRVAGEQRPGGPVVIQVAGEVRRPGVYRLSAGQRVQDAVRLAGGLTAKADLAGVNLAQKAEDGRQVIVPARGRGRRGRGFGRAFLGFGGRRPPRRSTSTRRRPSSSTSSTASVPRRRRRSSPTARSTAAFARWPSSTGCRGSDRRGWPL